MGNTENDWKYWEIYELELQLWIINPVSFSTCTFTWGHIFNLLTCYVTNFYCSPISFSLKVRRLKNKSAYKKLNNLNTKYIIVKKSIKRKENMNHLQVHHFISGVFMNRFLCLVITAAPRWPYFWNDFCLSSIKPDNFWLLIKEANKFPQVLFNL